MTKVFSAASKGARRLTDSLPPFPSLLVALLVAVAIGMTVATASRAAPAGGEAATSTGERLAGVARPEPPFMVADDAAAPAAPANAAPAAAPGNDSPPPASERISQENIFWASVEKSNSLADYKAYLEAYPNGAFAPLARNRIAAMTPAAETPQANPAAPAPPPGAPGQRPAGPPQSSPGAAQVNPPQPDENMPGPAENGPGAAQNGPGAAQNGPGLQNAPSTEALRAEVGTAETEQALNLNRRDASVLQERLAAQGLYSGPIDGDLGPGSRAAIAQWQQRVGTAPTGFLGPLLLETLQTDSAPVNGERINRQGCPPGFHAGRYGRRCWADR